MTVNQLRVVVWQRGRSIDSKRGKLLRPGNIAEWKSPPARDFSTASAMEPPGQELAVKGLALEEKCLGNNWPGKPNPHQPKSRKAME
jgi:hypothetical protein